ncbi:hypothetical protein J437_LFUL002394 [Ladona fulva]|uniref:Uncharacterized protein n=1 Tax=Ladona fulva TaxID=123851 RepID=A0A8K0K585_LADFU|nr:hypothetical protein J437_LFUL002394 [Ladona fulva]
MTEINSSYYSVQMRLTIRKFDKSDFGGYKCISKNSIGDAEGNIRLYVQLPSTEMELPYSVKGAMERGDSHMDVSGGADGDDSGETSGEGNRILHGYQGSLREDGSMSGKGDDGGGDGGGGRRGEGYSSAGPLSSGTRLLLLLLLAAALSQ